ncbi:uncharacterized protein [Battus philenor]|uniref:uncharacterized protein n=1 Tax=Battus philenor TaxID=42288 RepID=UPI0035D0713F
MNFKRKVVPTKLSGNLGDQSSLENCLNTNIQRVLFPLTLLQYAIFPKYRILHNLITPNNVTTNIIWSFYTVVVVALQFLGISQSFPPSLAVTCSGLILGIFFSLVKIKEIQILSIIWTIKNSFLLTVLSRECESVHLALKNAQIACKLSLIKIHLGTEHTECRQLRSFVEEETRPFSAKGLFIIDATLPVHILSLIVTYTIVILQFNFL